MAAPLLHDSSSAGAHEEGAPAALQYSVAATMYTAADRGSPAGMGLRLTSTAWVTALRRTTALCPRPGQ
jgi:hypothetical protein